MKQGMRLDLENGSVWIAPANDREALRVVTEAHGWKLRWNCAISSQMRRENGTPYEIVWYTLELKCDIILVRMSRTWVVSRQSKHP